MRRVEDALVAGTLSSHPNTTRALDRLLDDIAETRTPAVRACGHHVGHECISSDEVEEQLF